MEAPILDPLWITKGNSGFDSEYHTYVLLDANQKFRSKLKGGDISSFHEILFHSLNLNNLTMEGSIFDFKLNPVWEEPNLIKVRDYLRKVYDIPDDFRELFKNANYILTSLMLDYLDDMLSVTDDTRTFLVNAFIHNEDEVFIILNKDGSLMYDIWRLKYDKRRRFGYRIEHLQDIVLNNTEAGALEKAVQVQNKGQLDGMNPDTNVIFSISKEDVDNKKLASVVAMSLIFSRGVAKTEEYHKSILAELYDVLFTEKTTPFNLSSWV